YNPGQEDADGNGIGDICESNDTLPSGSDLTTDLNAGGDAINLIFDQIDTGGSVSVEVTSNGPPTASYFELYPSDPPKYYEFTTDVAFAGQVTITVGYDDAGMSPADESILRLWHYDPEWQDITTEHNLDSNIIRGVTTSFSPFALGFDRFPTDVADEISDNLPGNFNLRQNYPNPFNPSTTIEYDLPHRSHVRIDVLNVLGQKVRVLIDREETAGSHSITWDGTDDSGESVSTGIYLYRIQAGEIVESRKMLLLK
ncbi:MAG: FlgD immunoglobulin-like domain containing protein, partial [Candidatus Zixiibacteriota bacterium]